MTYRPPATCRCVDTLLNAYEQIGEVLPLLGEYRALFNGNSHFDQACAAIYGDVLEFH